MERSELPDISGDAGAAGAVERDASATDTSARRDPPAVTLFVCTTCRSAAETASPADGATLAEAAAALAGPVTVTVTVRSVRCLANCKRALSAAMVRRDGWTYVFGDLTADAAADLMEGARLLAEAPDGLMPWRGRPESLKRGMVARIPPLSLPEEPR